MSGYLWPIQFYSDKCYSYISEGIPGIHLEYQISIDDNKYYRFEITVDGVTSSNYGYETEHIIDLYPLVNGWQHTYKFRVSWCWYTKDSNNNWVENWQQWSDPITIVIGENPSIPGTIQTDYIPQYYPLCTDQWMGIPNTYEDAGQVGNCTAHAIVTMSDIHQYYKNGQSLKFSLCWAYGNRKSIDWQGEGMFTTQALSKLQEDGITLYTSIVDNMESKYGMYWYYPDNYFYEDGWHNGHYLLGAKSIISNINNRQLLDEAYSHKITSYRTITGNYYYRDIQNEILKHNAVLVDVNTGADFYIAENNGGFIPDDPGTVTGSHVMVIIGWKTENSKQYWICANNWGTWVGDNGRFYLPFTYTQITAFNFVTPGGFIGRPARAYWDTPKISGTPFNITKVEWDKFINNIKNVAHYYGINLPSQYALDEVILGSNFTADEFNEARQALDVILNAKGLSGTGLTDKKPGEIIYADYFITNLMNKLNSVSGLV